MTRNPRNEREALASLDSRPDLHIVRCGNVIYPITTRRGQVVIKTKSADPVASLAVIAYRACAAIGAVLVVIAAMGMAGVFSRLP